MRHKSPAEALPNAVRCPSAREEQRRDAQRDKAPTLGARAMPKRKRRAGYARSPAHGRRDECQPVVHRDGRAVQQNASERLMRSSATRQRAACRGMPEEQRHHSQRCHRMVSSAIKIVRSASVAQVPSGSVILQTMAIAAKAAVRQIER